jgi:hypothetical protein
MSDQINESMASVNVEEEIDVSRIRQLAGIANTIENSAGTPVAEALNAVEEKRLQDLLNDIEASIARTRVKFKQYAAAYQRMESLMDEDEQMHYGYGIQAMLDLVEEMHKELQKYA